MATPEELRTQRLRNDYAEMRRLHGEVIRVTAAGDPPASYRLQVRVKTIMGPGPTHRREHEVQVDLPAGYPWNTPPEVRMLTLPPPFHPNWFRNGLWCGGDWNPEESLARHVLRMVQTLQFQLDVTNPGSPANAEAAEWFRRNKEKGLFPCDRSILPDSHSGGVVLFEPERRLELLPDSDGN